MAFELYADSLIQADEYPKPFVDYTTDSNLTAPYPESRTFTNTKPPRPYRIQSHPSNQLINSTTNLTLLFPSSFPSSLPPYFIVVA